MEPEITPGGRGVFDVTIDGRTIFSKHAAHRFPEHDEIVRAVKAAQAT